MKYKFTWFILILFILGAGEVLSQAPGSVNSYSGTVTINGITGDVSETLLLGPGTYTVDGTWYIYSKYVWIDPTAVISGDGTILFYNPSDAMGASSATYIDGNNGSIDVNIELHNASNMVLADMSLLALPATWTEIQGNGSFGVGRNFSLMVDGGDVIMSMLLNETASHVTVANTMTTITNFIFDDDATITNYRPEKMVVTSNSIQGHMVKTGPFTSFIFPVGIAEGDYTPVQISPTEMEDSLFVSVQDYGASISDEGSGPEGYGIDRTWHIYSTGGAVLWGITLQHNTSTDQPGFDESGHFISQWDGSSWQTGFPEPGMPGDLVTPPGNVDGSSMIHRVYTNLEIPGTDPSSYFTKFSPQEVLLPDDALNCVSVISPAVGADGSISVQVVEIIPGNRNEPVYDVEVLNQWGGVIWKGENLTGADFILDGFDLCGYRGSHITIRISNGEVTCESNLVINESKDPVITSALGTTITSATDLNIPTAYIDTGLLVTYCGYVPDPSQHAPEVIVPCSSTLRSSRAFEVQVQPDWIEVFHCNEASDTSEIIYRTWEVFNKEGELFTLTDTIVVLRLPALNASNFVGYADDSLYCEIEPLTNTGETQKRYSAWKQPVGLHNYELPHTKLGGVVYEIPLTIIIAGLQGAEAQGSSVLDEYLDCVIVRKADGGEVTIGDIVSGDYIDDLIDEASSEELTYGFLHAIHQLNESPVSILSGLFSFFPYLLLEEGDWVLSEGGNFEEVTEDWFYTSTGNAPYWFTGGWPFISGGEDCLWYSDGHGGKGSVDCAVRVPALETDTDFCVEICLDDVDGNPHCGISITYEEELAGWSAGCSQTRGRDITVKQTCWGLTENACVSDEFINTNGGDGFVVEEENITNKGRTFRLSQWQTLIDTIGPIFDFCYPVADCGVMGETGPSGLGEFDLNRSFLQDDSECGGLRWCAEDITTSIRAGEQYGSAHAWEQCHPTIYRVKSHECESEVFVPDVKLIDHCSGVQSVKAVVEMSGGTHNVALEQTDVEYRILDGDDTSFVYTYSHLTHPIRIPFSGCDGALTEVRYEAVDHCWNQSTWSKFIQVIDDSPPTVVVDDEVNLTLTHKTEWVEAATFDEGSWDNCTIDLSLVRRSDWMNCIDICPDTAALPEGGYNSWVEVLDALGIDRNHAAIAAGGGTVGANVVNGALTIDDLATFLSEGEIEQYYFNQLVWLWEDGQNCGRKVVHGWIFALASYIAENCAVAVDHGNSLDVRDLEYIFDNLIDQPGYGNEITLLGGGWAQAAPFKCEDACLPLPGREVTAELLVMDACCNWGIGWSEVNVEDKSAVRVVKPLSDLEISCEAYNIFYKDLVEGAAALGENGSAEDSSGIFAVLDSVFGRYDLGSVGTGFAYNTITCREKSETVKIADTLHDGTIDWVNQVKKTTVLDTTLITGTDGLVDVVCAGEVSQDIWIDFDDCGNGLITRRFFISGGCVSTGAPLVFEQVIRVGSACGLSASMFDLPADLGSKAYPVCLPQTLSDTYFPEAFGNTTLKPNLAGVLCNSVAIGKEIKELTVLGQMGIKKYEVTWSMQDWCADGGELTYVQEVIAVIDPGCRIGEGINTVATDVVGGLNGNFTRKSKGLQPLVALYQNRPNPFEGYTVIGFELPKNTKAILTIYDITGRLLQEICGQYVKGYNEVTITRGQLPASGLLYYQLETEKFVATKKMVISD